MSHIHELIDFTVDVFIVYDDKVLLRKHEKYHRWLGVGGHIELDEDPVTAAKRECLEEVGLTVKIVGEDKTHVWGNDRVELVPPEYLNMHPINETHSHISFIYYATSDSNDVIPENHDDSWMWLTEKEVEAHAEIADDIKHYALSALSSVNK